MMVIVIGAMGLHFHLLLRTIWGNRFSSLLFSTAYAMMGFNVAYINCIHYFFSIMLLPLVILGLYRMMRTKRPSAIYIISASLSVISCYYIGYMILIFTAAFFLCFMFSGIIEYKDMRDRLKDAWMVLYCTLLAIGISAFSLFSVLLSLRGQKKAVIKGLMFGRNFNILEFFSGLYSGSFRGNISDGLPIIYCGVVTVIFVFLYFANKTIKIREKICALILFCFLIVGYWIDAFNVAWHGFAHPIGFPYRNSFLFSFFMLFVGYDGFVCIRDGFKKRSANVIVVIFSLYSVFLYFIGSRYVGIRSIIITGLTVASALILIVAMNEKNRYIVPALAGLFVLQIADCFYNGSVSVDSYFEDKDAYEESIGAYTDYIDSTEALVDFVNGQDSSFFRMEKLFRRTHNDPLMFAYNGLSHFSSCETDQVKTFMGRLGFRNNKNWAFYGDASTGFADCFMGVKYLLSQFNETCKPYKRIFSQDGKYIYCNPYALPLGFGMEDSVKYVNMSRKDPFRLQNDIASHFTDTNYQIYRPVKIAEVKLNNVTANENVYSKTDPDKEASIEYMLSISSDNFIYMYFDAPERQNATLFINGEDKGDYFSDYEWSVRECGYYEPGETISVMFRLDGDSLEIDNAYFYYESKQVLKAWYKDVVSTTCNVEKLSSSHLRAKINAANTADLIVFSIPYEEDWIVKVDGKKTQQVKIMDALLGVRITEGEHEIELRYIPKGIITGGPVSLAAILITIIILLKDRKKNILKNKKEASEA